MRRGKKAKTIVVALGGNAILKKAEDGTVGEQLKHINETCKNLVEIIKAGYNIVITHGNGPQIGNILLQNELAKRAVPAMPLDVCGAESQGLIGYLIQQALTNQLARAKLDKNVVTIVTQVVVDANDPAFEQPTKPIGPFYGKREAEAMERADKEMEKDPRDGYRRVVASPKPIEIVEQEVMKKLVHDGAVVIATGGGGIPVVRTATGELKGVEAVIDKDFAAALIAKAVGAEIFLNLTDVERVAINFGKPSQKELSKMTLSEARKYMKQGHFPPGNMGPKVSAAIAHLETGGKRAIIASIDQAATALEGKAGTTITK